MCDSFSITGFLDFSSVSKEKYGVEESREWGEVGVYQVEEWNQAESCFIGYVIFV